MNFWNKFKLDWDHIKWGWYNNPPYEGFAYYIYWWNWLPKNLRKWGRDDYFYDHPMPAFYLWYINITWYTQWTIWPK